MTLRVPDDVSGRSVVTWSEVEPSGQVEGVRGGVGPRTARSFAGAGALGASRLLDA